MSQHNLDHGNRIETPCKIEFWREERRSLIVPVPARVLTDCPWLPIGTINRSTRRWRGIYVPPAIIMLFRILLPCSDNIQTIMKNIFVPILRVPWWFLWTILCWPFSVNLASSRVKKSWRTNIQYINMLFWKFPWHKIAEFTHILIWKVGQWGCCFVTFDVRSHR